MPEVAAPASQGGPISIRDAALAIGKPIKEASPAPAAVETKEPVSREQPESAPQHESEASEAEDAAPPIEAETSGEETAEAGDQVSEPPIPAPRSWSKADKAVFETLPRESQARLAELDRTRELEIRRGQNEAAERNKALEAAERKATEVGQRYEQALPAITQMLQGELAEKFGDIRTQADAVNLSRTNPARFVEWQALSSRASAVVQEQRARAEQSRADAEAWFARDTAEETAKFQELAPEYADPKKSVELQTEAVELLKEKGYSLAEIEELWAGRKPVKVWDHRFQLLIRDAVKYKMATKATKAAKVMPQNAPVVRAGTPKGKGEGRIEQVRVLEQKLARTGTVKDAVALLRAGRAN